MTVDFYYTPGSPPCRAVMLTAKALGLEMNMKLLDLHHGEHMKPEFVKVIILTQSIMSYDAFGHNIDYPSTEQY